MSIQNEEKFTWFLPSPWHSYNSTSLPVGFSTESIHISFLKALDLISLPLVL